MSNLNHSEAKERAQKFSMEHGNSAERFGHKDYYAAKKGGASDADILKQLDANPDTLYSGNAKGSGGLYDQIASGALSKQGGSNTNTQKDIGNTTQTVTQDNDQTSTVNGNNNYVNQNQDNSVRNYGGDNRVFNYQGGSGNNSPVSAATMAGYYAPDDSPAAKAKRLDQNVTMNRDNQKKYANTSHIAEGAIKRAANNAYIDPAALDKRIGERSEYHRSKATLKGNQIFGDLFGMDGPTWNSAKPAEEIEKPDFENMYKKYTDF